MRAVRFRRSDSSDTKTPERSASRPLVRGLDWAPMAFWLNGDRIVTPHWSRPKLDAIWATAQRDIRLIGSAEVHAYVPAWLFPPT